MGKPRTVKQFIRHLGYQARRASLPLRSAGFSSFGEEELLEKFVAELLPRGSRTAVDIGAGDGRTGSNTLALFKSGWRGVGVEWDAGIHWRTGGGRQLGRGRDGGLRGRW
jgi:hypothetical protein